MEQGIPLDATWATRLRDAANRAQLVTARRRRILSWIGKGLGGLPIEHLPDVIEKAIEWGEKAAEQTGKELWVKSPMKRYAWYYALVSIKDGRSETKSRRREA